MTDQGTRAFEAIMARQAPWVNELARGLALDDITAATDVLRRIEERFDAIGSAGEASTPEVRKRLR